MCRVELVVGEWRAPPTDGKRRWIAEPRIPVPSVLVIAYLSLNSTCCILYIVACANLHYLPTRFRQRRSHLMSVELVPRTSDLTASNIQLIKRAFVVISGGFEIGNILSDAEVDSIVR